MAESGNIESLTLRDLKPADYMKAEAGLSVDQKSALAMHLAATLNATGGNPQDAANVEAILRLIIWNAEPRVVEAMAQAAAKNPNTPHGLAWALANDDEAAAIPILESSTALSDADFVAIVEASQNFLKMGAIACRSTVSETVSRSLARHGDENTARSLLNNAKADIPGDAFASMLDRHGHRARIQEAMIDRDPLLPAIAARLAGLVDTQLAEKLARRHQAAQSAAVVGYDEGLSFAEMDELAARMVAEKSITPPFLVRKLCAGNFELFCTALSALTTTPRDEVRTRALKPSFDDLLEIWEKASLPVAWLPVACAAAQAVVHLDKNQSKLDPQLFRRNIVDRTQATLRAEKHVLTDAQKNFFRAM